MYRPKLKILDDVLYVSHNTGIFSKKLNEADSEWEPFALGDLGQPITDFVKNGDNLPIGMLQNIRKSFKINTLFCIFNSIIKMS